MQGGAALIKIGSFVGGTYKVLEKIGQGGMSVVYLAINERANKMWAIKEVRKDGVQDFDMVCQGIMTEIHILKGLNHKYLPAIVDVIDTGDTLLIVMDYIQGKSLYTVLNERLEEEGIPPGVEEVLSWGRQICDVLYYLHTRPQPVIYRDLKPGNVMLKPDGDICVVDFGIARVFKKGKPEDTTCLGTPGYAAPEQYGGGQSRPQTDIYNFGATLHHLITGRDPQATPFYFPRITCCRPSLLEETPARLRGALLGLEMIIERCTRYGMEERYASCAELKYDLEHPQTLGLPYRRKLSRALYAFLGCVCMALVFGGASLFGMGMERHTANSGYDYYLERAKTAGGKAQMDFYKKAVALDPVREEAYLQMLDVMTADGDFSAEDERTVTSVLHSKAYGRAMDNQAYLQTNKSGYVKFAYKMGTTYYYDAADGSGDKSVAAGWFEPVAEADMDALDLGADEPYKEAWQARARVLGRIGSYYKSKLGVTNRAGDAEVSYRDYWNDLMALLDGDVAGKDNTMTELRLYNEIVGQICTRAVEFKNEAGLTRDAMEQALAEVERCMDRLPASENQNSSGSGTSKNYEKQLVEALQSNIRLARKNIEAVFSTDGETQGEGDGI